MPITTTPSGGPQGDFSTYTPIYAQTLSSATSSITFSNIPTTYTDLVLVSMSVAATGTTFPWIRFNGLSTNIYSDVQLTGNGTSAASYRRAAQSRGYISEQVQHSTTAGSTTTVTHIMNYSNTTTFKTYLVRNNNAESGTYVGTEVIAGSAQLTAPITSITIGCAAGGVDYNHASGSTFTLYGIKAAAPAPKATGGDVITTDGTYWYHAFKTSGLFDVKQSLTADVLVVAGGGGGGISGSTAGYGGGGGAGGYRSATSQSFSSQAYLITVGAGGSTNTKGSNSSISGSGLTTITSTGGGFGGNATYAGRTVIYSGGSGGSGGGAGNRSDNNNGQASPAVEGYGNQGGYTPVEGYNGGTGYVGGGNAAGSGGGGATSAGSSGTNNGAGGAGGNGSNAHSTWASATGTGVSGYYAGGGGGGTENNTYAGGAGGSGGGGKGSGSDGTGVAGTANTGGGGGGNGSNGAKSGGSGIVIVRYAV